MEYTIIDKANYLIQSNTPLILINSRITYDPNRIAAIRKGKLSFDKLTLAEIKILARYYDIYGTDEDDFTDQREFLYTYVEHQNYFSNGDLAIFQKNEANIATIYSVIVNNAHIFIDSIIDKYPFHELFENLSELPKEHFYISLKRYFICHIHEFVTKECAGISLIPIHPHANIIKKG